MTAPQQPTAQEREDRPRSHRPGCRELYEVNPQRDLCTCRAAPPSEADSAGEDQPCTCPTAWWDALRQWGGPGGVHLAACPVHVARLAASSGVRGGDDQARERLADVLALHRMEPMWLDGRPWCPTCREGWPCATTRAAGGQP